MGLIDKLIRTDYVKISASNKMKVRISLVLEKVWVRSESEPDQEI